MSRVGLKPIDLPSGVTVTVSDNLITVKGTKGELKQDFSPVISFDIQEKAISVSRANDAKESKSMHGLYRNLVNNMITGVSKGFSKTLIINGVGYRAEVSGQIIKFNLGFSHPISFILPNGITAVVEGNNKLTVSGISKEIVGQVASEIRGLRPPEPYKGKGIKYDTEQIRRKVGKSGVK